MSTNELDPAIRDAYNALANLTVDEIAHKLEAEQCTGLPMSGASCPLARYFQRANQDDSVNDIYVGASQIHITRNTKNSEIYVDLSDGMREFIRAFDFKYYPDLISRTRIG